MAYFHSPRIVTDGLILALDAANTKSYPGSGTTWFDLSGNGNNATLDGNVNNPAWNSSGYWSFAATSNGINGGMLINNSTSLSNIGTSATVELIFTLETKTVISGDSAWMALFSRGGTGAPSTNQNPAISINQTNDGTFRYLHIERPSAFNSAANLFTDYTGNKWYHAVAALGSTSFGYLNAVQVSTAAGGITANVNPIFIGYDGDNEMFKGKLAIVRFYNRQLSAAEILQNYNATKGRFGL
jgi:hypothetical protein